MVAGTAATAGDPGGMDLCSGAARDRRPSLTTKRALATASSSAGNGWSLASMATSSKMALMLEFMRISTTGILAVSELRRHRAGAFAHTGMSARGLRQQRTVSSATHSRL